MLFYCRKKNAFATATFGSSTANDDFPNPRVLAAKVDVLWNAKCQCVSTSVNGVTTQQQKKQDMPKESDNWCYYHSKFGNSARNCKAPCEHPSASSLQMNSVNSCSDGKSTMLYVKDDLSGHRFLVETEARVSVFPATWRNTRYLAADFYFKLQMAPK